MSQMPPNPLDYAAPAPGPRPASGSSGNKTLLIVLIALLGLTAAAGAVLVLGLGESDDKSSPTDTVRALYDAAQGQDCAAALDLVTEQSWPVLFASPDDITAAESPSDVPAMTREEALSACKSSSDETFDGSEQLVSAELKSESGDTAVVAATTKTGRAEDTAELPLVKQGGAWKVDFVAFWEEHLDSSG